MLTKDQAAAIFSKLKAYAATDEVEATFYGGQSALTRFANNTIHQNVAEEHYGVSVRTTLGGRTARATTNKFDDSSLQQVVKASAALAQVQEPDPDQLSMPDTAEAYGKQPHRRRIFPGAISIRPPPPQRTIVRKQWKQWSILPDTINLRPLESLLPLTPSKAFLILVALLTGTSKPPQTFQLPCWRGILPAGRKPTRPMSATLIHLDSPRLQLARHCNRRTRARYPQA